MSKKRANSEGTISQRPDGRWEARICFGYEAGKLKRKSFYGKTREEVSKQMVTALAELNAGRTLPDEKVTLENFLESWLEGTAKARVRTSTYRRYRTLIKNHINPHVGKIPVGKLSPQQAQRLWTTLQKADLSGRTIIQVRAVLRTALNQALRHGLTNRNSAALTDAPKPSQFEHVYLTADESKALLEAAKGHKLEALITLALTTGLRMGEILGLTWNEIDLEAKQLRVSQQQQRVGDELVLIEPKTSKSKRSIPLTQIAVDALKSHRQHQIDLHRVDSGRDRIVSGRVFVNERGAPLENSTALRQFYRLLDKSGLKRMRLHDLRHSCATLLVSMGVHPRLIMELLGHSTIAMTMNVYSHVSPEIARQTATAMESMFAPKAANDAN